MSNTHPVHDVSGRCLCGSVRYQVSAVRRELIHCHCEICRRMTGAVWIGTHAVRSDLTIEDDDCLAWYQSTDHSSRGFSRKCGSTLFFDSTERPTIGIAAGSVDQPSGLELVVHIFTSDAADYTRFTDDIRQVADGQHGLVYP